MLWDPVRDARKEGDKQLEVPLLLPIPCLQCTPDAHAACQIHEAVENEYQHAFTKKNDVVLAEYRDKKGLHPQAVCIEPFLCKFREYPAAHLL